MEQWQANLIALFDCIESEVILLLSHFQYCHAQRWVRPGEEGFSPHCHGCPESC